MGLLSNLWHGKGNERFERMAHDYAEMFKQEFQARIAEGDKTEQATDAAIWHVAGHIAGHIGVDMNLFGYTHLLKTLPDAFVVQGMSRDSASQLKNQIRSAVAEIRDSMKRSNSARRDRLGY